MMGFTNKLKRMTANYSAAAKIAIANAKLAAADYGLRHVIDNGEPRCLFAAKGDACEVTIINVAKFADAFRRAGFEEDRNMLELAFRFAPERMAEVAAIVCRADIA